ncbi:hypothetical protein [Neptuniibacter sp. QD57_21]|uniref:hypothetical protein n=1 Tax=Neptuniibacter sp. QD57_21 TaxID=3398213 RepID=UPI0039F44F2B
MPIFDDNSCEHIHDMSLAAGGASGIMISIGFFLSLELVGGLAGLFLAVMGLSHKAVYKLVFNKLMAKANWVLIVGGGLIFPFGFLFQPLFFIPLICIVLWCALFLGSFEQL